MLFSYFYCVIVYKTYSDNDIISHLQKGDETAFAELYHRYWLELYDAAYKRLKNKEQVEDIIQDVFLKLWIRRSELNIENPKSYLHTAIRFRVFNYLERDARSTAFFEPFTSLAFTSESADGNVLEKELISLIDSYIECLPRKRKEIFLLYTRDNLSTNEIASRLNISQKTVQNQLGTAIDGLHARIAPVIIALIAAQL